MKRGFSPKDDRDFKGASLVALKHAADDLFYLLNRGYPVKGASTFIGNHYQLSERQRIALMRAVTSKEDIVSRDSKQKQAASMAGETVHIDGFNEIITLEVALSGSPVLVCMDGTYRDLAGLRGTYRLIDKTEIAVKLILSGLAGLSIQRAVFWLDAPVSNSGRLKTLINKAAEAAPFVTEVNLAGNVDHVLYGLQNVITSDSAVLDRCPSWFNLKEQIVPGIPGVWVVNLIGSFH